ncbi:membrane-targeted effector domain-containing toxin [Pseudomonas graminis]
MNVSTLSQQPRLNQNALFLQVDPPPQNESGRSTQSSTQSGPSTPGASDAGITREQLKTPENLRALAKRLKAIFPPHTLTAHPTLINLKLNRSAVPIHLDTPTSSGSPTTLSFAKVLTKLGYTLPTNGDELRALMRQVDQQIAMALLGNKGGALSWPTPMSQADKSRLDSFLLSDTTGVPGLPLPPNKKGTLGYLVSGSAVTPSDLQDPPKALETLLLSPKAATLGQALQNHLEGAPSEAGIYDYVLAAIQIGLDPTSKGLQRRNNVDGVDLMQPAFWGKTASTVVAHLTSDLIAKGRVTADTAKLGAHLLLARRAPHLLIKDIPDNVTIGSHSWAFLSIAAARIEAERPGTVAKMSFADVMSYPEPTGERSQTTQHAQASAIIDWGIVNGVIKKDAADNYTTEQINIVRTEFNQQLTERLAASKELERELPTLKEIAVSELDKRFDGPEDLYEAQVLSTDQYRGTSSQTGLAGMHSMLDIAMMGLPNLRPFVSSNPRIPLEALNKNLHFDAPGAFDQQFKMAIDRKKAAVNTTVRHLISQLPAEDRRQFEFGKITLFREGSYTLGTGFFGTTDNGNKPGLIVKTERDDDTRVYVIDLNKAAIERVSTDRARERDVRDADVVSTTREFKTEDAASGLGRESPTIYSLPNTFNSQRARDIANEYVKHIDLDNPDIKQQSRGQTTLDKLQGGPKPLDEMLLNLIPFRSAVVNFQKGQYGEAAFDLTMDIFGFLTAGVATAGKLIKIGTTVLSTSAKALKAVKVIGAATVGVLNPLDGLGDFAYGGANLLRTAGRKLYTGGTYVVNALKGATGSYDLLKAASKSNGVAATGTYKLADQAAENGAILKDKKWYAYDPINQRPYGPPLTDFKPDVIAANSKTLAKFDETTQKWHLYDPVKQQVEGPPLENFTLERSYSLDTLMPATLKPRSTSRFDPMGQTIRPTQQVSQPGRVPLPTDAYSTSRQTDGKLILDHFTPSRLQGTRAKFRLEMNEFFKDAANGHMPPRPVLPTINAKTTPDELFAESLKKTDVLVFGENHNEVASLITLRDSMKTFKDNGVKTIYLEGTDFDPVGKIADGHIKRNIKARSGGATLYEEVQAAAQANGIQIVPLEHHYLTRHMDDKDYFHREMGKHPKGSPAQMALTKERLQEVNYYGASQVLKNKPGEKSIVWVGRKHMTTGESVPGIAELTGGISIGIYQKAGINQSVVHNVKTVRDPALSIPTADDTVGDFQLFVKV